MNAQDRASLPAPGLADRLIGRLRPRQAALQIAIEIILVLTLGFVLLRARDFAWTALLAVALVPPLRVAAGSDLIPPPVKWPMLVWLGAMGMALLIGIQLRASAAWNRFWPLAFGVVVFGAIWNLARSERLRRVMPIAWLLIVFGAGLLGLTLVPANAVNKIPFLTTFFARIAAGSQSIQNSFRSEDGINPNTLAGLLMPAMFLPFGLLMWLRQARPVWRVPAMPGLGFIGLVMLLSVVFMQSRGGYLGVIAGVMALLAMRNRRWALFALGALGLAAVGLLFVLPALDIDAQSYSSGRVDVWLRAAKMISQFPITGVGLNMFAPVSELLYKDMLNGQPSLIHAHNMFLQLWLDYGLFGFLAALGVIVLVWSRAISGMRGFAASGDAFSLWVLRALMAGQAAWFVFNFTDYANFGSKQSAVFWAAWGLILGFTRLRAVDTASA